VAINRRSVLRQLTMLSDVLAVDSAPKRATRAIDAAHACRRIRSICTSAARVRIQHRTGNKLAVRTRGAQLHHVIRALLDVRRSANVQLCSAATLSVKPANAGAPEAQTLQSTCLYRQIASGATMRGAPISAAAVPLVTRIAANTVRVGSAQRHRSMWRIAHCTPLEAKHLIQQQLVTSSSQRRCRAIRTTRYDLEATIKRSCTHIASMCCSIQQCTTLIKGIKSVNGRSSDRAPRT
jgi:hypothetical protein